MRKFKKSYVVALSVLALVVSAPAAFGQESSVQGYNSSGPSVAGDIQGGANGPDSGAGDVAGNNVAAASSDDPAGGSLPFTGSDLGLLAAAGTFLLAFGLGMRRLTRSTSAV